MARGLLPERINVAQMTTLPRAGSNPGQNLRNRRNKLNYYLEVEALIFESFVQDANPDFCTPQQPIP